MSKKQVTSGTKAKKTIVNIIIQMCIRDRCAADWNVMYQGV